MEPFVLSTNTAAIRDITLFLKSKIAPVLIEMASNYNALDIGKFDQEVFEDITQNRIKNITEQFRIQVEKDIAGTKLPDSVKKMMDSDSFQQKALKPLHDSIELFHNLISNQRYGPSVPGSAELTDIKIINGLPLIDEKAIEARFQIVVDTDEKHEIYKDLLEIVSIYDKLRQKMNDYGVQFFPAFEDLFDLNFNGSISINTDSFQKFFGVRYSEEIISRIEKASPHLIRANRP